MANNQPFVLKNAVEVGKNIDVTLGTISSSAVNLATGNYFAETLTANTTYTFSNPGDVQSFQMEITGGSAGYALSTATQANEFNVGASGLNPVGIVFKSDGLKMFVSNYGDDEVQEWDLSTAWDISTATFNSAKAIGSLQGNPRGLYISPDGLHMYLNDTDNRDVVQYSLSTAWDVSTASHVRDKDVSAQVGGSLIHGIFFSYDGTKMYVTYSGTYQYTLSTAWDISTASYDGHYVTFSTQYTIYITDDGTTLLAWGSANTLHKYDLSTDWDLSTASSSVDSIASPGGISAPYNALWFKPDGTKFYFTSHVTDKAYEFDSVSGYTITWPASVDWPSGTEPNDPASGEKDIYSFITPDDGTTYYGFKSATNVS